MLSDINLLPQREQRSIFFILALTIILSIGLIGGGILFYQYHSLSREIDAKQSESKIIAKQIEKATAELLTASLQSMTGQYQEIVNTLVNLPIQTVKILNDMTAALPKNGYFKSYTYQDTGTISLTATFNSMEETAQYLHQLTVSDWVEHIEISSVSKQDNETESILYEANYSVQLKREAFPSAKGADGD